MSTGTTMSVSTNEVTLGHKNHWLKFSNYILTKAKAYGDVSRLLQHRQPIDYYTQLLSEKERRQITKNLTCLLCWLKLSTSQLHFLEQRHLKHCCGSQR